MTMAWAPVRVAGPGAATNAARPRRTWTSSARIETRDLGRGHGAEVEAGRRSDGGDALRRHALTGQVLADRDGPRGRGDQPDVGDVARQGSGDGLLVPGALAGDDDIGRRRCVEAAQVGRLEDLGGIGKGLAWATGSTTLTR